MNEQDKQKKAVAEAAIEYIKDCPIFGVGTGTTANFFIDALVPLKANIEMVVASSVASEQRLKKIGIEVQDLNYVGKIPVYVDGADEFNHNKQLIKGGGGALTREKIIAAASKKFVCITDQTKKVDVLGRFPLPVEVIPMARGYVARQLVELGGSPEYREGFVTDNGNIILDVHALHIIDPVSLEAQINNITGVVTVGLFAKRPADVVLMASSSGVQVF